VKKLNLLSEWEHREEGRYIYLYDPDYLSESDKDLFWFDPVEDFAEGRASILIRKSSKGESIVSRRYCRGGFIKNFIRNYYFFSSLFTTRVWKEIEVQQMLLDKQIPVSQPVGAIILKVSGLFCQMALLTMEIKEAKSLLSVIRADGVTPQDFFQIGKLARDIAHAGVWHRDFHPGNVLCSRPDNPQERKWYAIDFDKAGKSNSSTLISLEKRWVRYFEKYRLPSYNDKFSEGLFGK